MLNTISSFTLPNSGPNVLKNAQLPQQPFSTSWKPTIGNVNEWAPFWAVQGFFNGTATANNIYYVVCVYNGASGTYNDGTHGALPCISPVIFGYTGQIVNIRGLRIISAGYDIMGNYFSTNAPTSNGPEYIVYGGIE